MIERLSQPFFLPAIIFGFAYLAVPYYHYLPDSLANIFELGPFWTLAIVALLASVFNRVKVLLIIVMVAAAYTFKDYQDDGLLHQFSLLALVPANLFIVCLYTERGVLSYASMWRLLFVFLQSVGIYYSNDISLPTITGLSMPRIEILDPVLFEVWPVWLPPLQLGFLIAVTALLGVLTKTLISPSPIANSIFGATAGYCLTTWLPLSANVEGAFFITIAIILARGLLRDYYNMAYRDELTTLPQRRALNEHLSSLGRNYTLAMLDVDHFKKFNDTHGHDVGDQVLKMVAGQIRNVEGGGKAYRYGGEEFTVVFTGTDSSDAAGHLNMVRKNIAAYEMVIRDKKRPEENNEKSRHARERGSFRKSGKKVSVTISIGVASRRLKSDQPDDVLKRADKALYRAKHAGRNKVSVDTSDQS